MCTDVEREGLDRYNTTLPGFQEDLLSKIISLRIPVVLVLIHGGSVSLGAYKDPTPAILDAIYGGRFAAEAIAAILFGVHSPRYDFSLVYILRYDMV